MQSYPEEYGGQGMPQSMSLMHAEILATACWSWNMYPVSMGNFFFLAFARHLILHIS